METITIDEIDFSSKSEVVEEVTSEPIETKVETNNIQTFNFEELPVRTLEIDGETYFVGKDVAEILGYARPTKAIADHVDFEDKRVVPIQDSIGREQETPIINESGLYALIFGSRLDSAKRFKRWVTSEVLPQIRKTGKYEVQPVQV